MSWLISNKWLPLLGAGVVLAISPAQAQDKITLNSGEVYTGKILQVANGQATIEVPQGKIPLRLATIASVSLDVPREMEQARKETDPKKQLQLVVPLVNRYQGLPVGWVVEALGLAAEAKAALGDNATATAIYDNMLKLYPGSVYEARAKAGLASQALATGDAAKALTMVGPLIAEADKTLLPGHAEGEAYGAAYLVQGQAQEKQGKYADALTSYLTVVTVFHQNPSIAQAAQKAADTLRKTHPDVIVE